MKPVTTFTTIGAIIGIYVGIKKQKNFWATAGITLLFSLGGAALGTAYDKMINE